MSGNNRTFFPLRNNQAQEKQKAEEERIAKEKADAEEIQRIQAENEMLKIEAEAIITL